MRLLLITAAVMVAFAANSVINRVALVGGLADPASFAVIRLAAGAGVLACLMTVQRRAWPAVSLGLVVPVAALLLYIFGFSLGYLQLDAGVGALVLFGAVQLTMMAGALRAGDTIAPRRWVGAAAAMAGLAWLLWPSPNASVSAFHGMMMVLAGVGWGVYSLVGRRVTDPTAATAANFTLAAIVAALVLSGAMAVGAAPIVLTNSGIGYAILSGAVTSGLAYSVWYAVLPKLATTQAATAQLTVPVIAFVGGGLALGELPTVTVAAASCLVLAGVAISAWPEGRKPTRN